MSSSYDLASGFSGLCEAEQFADIFLLVEGQSIPAHKAVLYSRSPYFCRMFAVGSDLREARQCIREVPLVDIPLSPFRKVLRYWYSGQLQSSQDTLELLEVLKLADYFQADELITAVATELCRSDRAVLCFRSALRLLGLAFPHVGLAKGGKCIGDDDWSNLWRHAMQFVQHTFQGTGWLCSAGIAALEELREPRVAHLALRFLSPDLPPIAAQAILSALLRHLDISALASPFRKLDFGQTENSVELEFTREHWAGDDVLGDELSANMMLLGCIHVQCKVFPNGRVLESVRWNHGILKTWISDNSLACDEDCLHTVVPTALTTLRCGACVQTDAGFNLRSFPGWQMSEATGSAVFSCRAAPPPLAQVIIRGYTCMLLSTQPAPCISSSLPVALFRAVLQGARSAPPLRLVETAARWAKRQDDGAGTLQLQQLLAEISSEATLWELLQYIQSVKTWPSDLQPKASALQERASNTENLERRTASCGVQCDVLIRPVGDSLFGYLTKSSLFSAVGSLSVQCPQVSSSWLWVGATALSAITAWTYAIPRR
mmetsp:Transcript_29019/g.51950  ORF Transcript_29019/g.51950 Transcript_29019/m.51950 type:complete len:546 (+) Transcript_29019:76-1713(+)